jgi:hypothetical protein
MKIIQTLSMATLLGLLLFMAYLGTVGQKRVVIKGKEGSHVLRDRAG